MRARALALAPLVVAALAGGACSASPDGTAAEHYARALEHARAGSRTIMFAQPPRLLRLRAELERAVALDPGSVDARSELARYYLAAPRLFGGGDARAAAEIARLRALAPARAAVLEGWRHHHAERPRDAAAVLQAAARDYPDSAATWFALAHVLRDAERNDDAAAALRRGLALRPDYAPGHWQLGLVGATTGTHLADAERSLLAYLKTTPAKGEPALHVAHWRLGMVYEKQGRFADAKREYEAAWKGRRDSDYLDGLKRVR